MNNTQKLFELAQASFHNAHCPYSHFAVGAAILSDNGKFYSGCNVENVSYPEGTCAESGAIAAMINDGGKKITEILILGNGKDLITPCGGCRQRICEFATPTTLVHLADMTGIVKTMTINDLLPLSFK